MCLSVPPSAAGSDAEAFFRKRWGIRIVMGAVWEVVRSRQGSALAARRGSCALWCWWWWPEAASWDSREPTRSLTTFSSTSVFRKTSSSRSEPAAIFFLEVGGGHVGPGSSGAGGPGEAYSGIVVRQPRRQFEGDSHNLLLGSCRER